MNTTLGVLVLSSLAALPASGETHWAYRELPRESGAGIDALVRAELKEQDLELAPRSAPDLLLRRVHLLLTGLPPTPEELSAFRSDSSPEAYRAVVDALLARSGFGERWGRHWLDLAGYADSSGLHEDSDRPHAWRYRDYVIRSFNEDKPYGRFIMEQIAGDQFGRSSEETLTATGFCRTGPSNEGNVGSAELESYRLEQLDGIVKMVSNVFLGQTVGCARCHDHKTDPFSARDYYSMLAVFNNANNAFVPLKGEGLADPVYLRTRVRKAPQHPKGPGIRSLAELPPAEHRPTYVLERGDLTAPGEEVQAGIPLVLSELPIAFEADGKSPRVALAKWIGSPHNALTWRVMANRVWQHLFGRGIVATPSNLGVSGAAPSHRELLDHLAIRLRNGRGRIKPLIRDICLSQTFQQSSAYRQMAFETDPDNRLLWRYPPQRLEAEGIRDSILFASGRLNREMGGPGIKPRIPPEILRQSMRNTWPKVGREGPEHWRRSVYIYQKRQLRMPMMELLDAPDTSESCALRFSSTTPTQALALLNDAFVNEQAGFAAQRARREKPDAAVPHLIELIWARTPSPEQIAKARDYLARPDFTLTDLAVVLFNASPFVYVD